MQDTGDTALGRCVGDAGVFVRDHWARKPCRRSATDTFADVLTLDTFDEFVCMAARWPALRLVRNGCELARAEYCASTPVGGRVLDDVVDPHLVRQAFRDGVTVVAQSLHRQMATVSRFAAKLEDEISHPVQVNAYLSPGRSVGLRPHHDLHEVIAVQLHGAKSWWVEGIGEFEQRPGDVVYVPKGVRHSAETTSEASLHMTIGIIPVTYRAVLQRELGRCDALDAVLPLGFARSAANGDTVTGLLEATNVAVRHMHHLDPRSVVGRERARRTTRRDRRGMLESLARLDDVSAEAQISLIGLDADVEVVDGGRVRFTSASGSVTAPGRTGPALRHLVAARTARAGDLPGLDADSQIVPARRLVEEGMCTCRTGTGKYGPRFDNAADGERLLHEQLKHG